MNRTRLVPNTSTNLPDLAEHEDLIYREVQKLCKSKK